MIRIKTRVPSYEVREAVWCVTLEISMLSRGSDGTVITAILDRGLSTERSAEWKHAEDHPVFMMEPRKAAEMHRKYK